MDSREIVAKHSAAHDPEDVIEALRQISSTREQKGFFLSNRPKEILPPGKEKIRKLLDDKREQLILNVTENCNFRCSYCVYGGEYKNHRTHSSKTMTWDVALPAIDEFLTHSGGAESRVISFYGGEPLLNLPLIRQCVSHVRRNYGDMEVKFSLTTNGLLMKDGVADFLATENFMIILSLDGPEEIHDRHRRTKTDKPTWKEITDNIARFLAAHPEYRTNGHLRFNAVATRTTDLCQADQFWASSEMLTDSMGLDVNFQKQTGADGDMFRSDDVLLKSRQSLHDKFVRDLKDDLFAEEFCQQKRWLQRACFEKPLFLFHKRGYLSKPLPEKMRFLNHCPPGARRTFLSIEGDYYACERVILSSEQKIGNIRQGMSLEKIMNLLERWIQTSKHQCRNCWCLPTYYVGCFATVSRDGALCEQAKSKACEIHRQNTHNLLEEYCSILEANSHAFDYVTTFELQ